MKVLTDCVKTSMASGMFSTDKSWPFGLNRANWVLYIFAVLVVFSALSTLDTGVTRFVSALPDLVRKPFFYITRAGKSDWIFLPTILVTLIGLIALKLPGSFMPREFISKLTWRAFFIIAAVGVPGLTALFFKRFLGRARPTHLSEWGAFHFQPVLNDWSFQSFPSGDTTTIFALAAALTFLMPKFRFLFFVGAVLVGLSRIFVGMHFPTDVFGGMLTGLFGAYAVRNYFAAKGWIFQDK